MQSQKKNKTKQKNKKKKKKERNACILYSLTKENYIWWLWMNQAQLMTEQQKTGPIRFDSLLFTCSFLIDKKNTFNWYIGDFKKSI